MNFHENVRLLDVVYRRCGDPNSNDRWTAVVQRSVDPKAFPLVVRVGAMFGLREGLSNYTGN